MILHDVTQGTEEWAKLRAGIPTSSEFSRIVTPTGKPSKSHEGYIHELIAERLLGKPLDGGFISLPMARGSSMEAEAVSYYEFQTGSKTEEVGFVTTDDGRAGTSPDRLVGEAGLLEVKCPNESTHVGYLLLKPVDRKYYPQLQGQLWITGREWVDILSYHRDMPEALVRVQRDEEYIKTLSGAVRTFCHHLETQYRELLNEIGGPEVEALDPLELQLGDVA